jgi:hypothetical protein
MQRDWHLDAKPGTDSTHVTLREYKPILAD